MQASPASGASIKVNAKFQKVANDNTAFRVLVDTVDRCEELFCRLERTDIPYYILSLIHILLDRQNTGSPGYWVGHPNEKTIPLLAEAWGIEPTREAIQTYLDDDLRWVPADAAYHHPEGRPAFDPTYGIERHSLATEGCLAEAETLRCV